MLQITRTKTELALKLHSPKQKGQKLHSGSSVLPVTGFNEVWRETELKFSITHCFPGDLRISTMPKVHFPWIPNTSIFLPLLSRGPLLPFQQGPYRAKGCARLPADLPATTRRQASTDQISPLISYPLHQKRHRKRNPYTRVKCIMGSNNETKNALCHFIYSVWRKVSLNHIALQSPMKTGSRNIESLGLEKTPMITQSNHQPVVQRRAILISVLSKQAREIWNVSPLTSTREYKVQSLKIPKEPSLSGLPPLFC